MLFMKQRVLFLCAGNSVRSQMVEGLKRRLAGDRYAAVLEPAEERRQVFRTVRDQIKTRIEEFLSSGS
jgi:protein-tyrosine-phosphatase